MKQLFLMVLCCLVFAGCSDDDNAGSGLNQNGTLLKKIIVKDGDEVFQSGTFEYRNDKLYKRTISVAGASEYAIYEYTGNLITKANIFRESALAATEYYTYNSAEQLINFKYVNHASDYVFYTNYVYDGPKITVTSYKGTAAEQSEVLYRKIAHLENGEVTKLENYSAAENVLQYTTTYVFDDKNSPYKMIPGYNKLKRLESGIINSSYNILAFRYSVPSTTQIDEDVIEVVYNSYGYPIKTTEIDPFDNNGNNIIREYFYE